jgi:hypothetical protein
VLSNRSQLIKQLLVNYQQQHQVDLLKQLLIMDKEELCNILGFHKHQLQQLEELQIIKAQLLSLIPFWQLNHLLTEIQQFIHHTQKQFKVSLKLQLQEITSLWLLEVVYHNSGLTMPVVLLHKVQQELLILLSQLVGQIKETFSIQVK